MSDFEKFSRIFKYNPETGELLWNAIRKGTTSGKAAGSISRDRKGNVRYLRVYVGENQHRAHRICWLLQTGEWPKYEIDHIDGNPLNNKWANLRDVPHAVNKKNNRLGINNKSGIPGVWWSEQYQTWKPYINSDGKRKYLPNTGDFFEACCMRKSAEVRFGFHANHGRVGV